MLEHRIKQLYNPCAQQLMRTILRKQSNLTIAADLTDATAVLALAEATGPHICCFKTHADIIRDFDERFVIDLQALARQHDFMLFEDRKFADIGHTVREQYAGGLHHIVDWAHIIDAHVLPGPGIIEGLRKIGLAQQRGLLLLAQMSSQDNLLNDDYTRQAAKLAIEYPDFVMGFICQERFLEDDGFIYCTPGVQLTEAGDDLGQRYRTPEQAIAQGNDVIIVGRGIYGAADPKLEAARYQNITWRAYCDVNN